MAYSEDQKPVCTNCGENKDFDFLYSRARYDWYRCKNCQNEQITALN